MTKKKWQKIEKEFDEKFESDVRTGNEQEGFWWALNTTNPDDIKSFLRQKLEEREKEILEKVLEIVKEDREKSEKEFEKLDKSPPDYLWEEAYEEAIRFWEGAVRICKDIEKEIKKLLKRSGIKN